eukprot:403339972
MDLSPADNNLKQSLLRSTKSSRDEQNESTELKNTKKNQINGSNIDTEEESKGPLNSNDEKLRQGKQWIGYSLAAAFVCAACNSMISDISILGFEGLLYLQPGATLSGFVFFSYLSIQNYAEKGSFKVDLNLKHWYNILMFVMFSLVYLTYQTLVVLTFNFSLQANVNPGLVSTIWATTPLFAGFMDYVLFGQRLTKKHLIGVICLAFCVVCISLTPVIYAPQQSNKIQTIQPWVPVTLALISPIFFATSNIQTKYLTTKRGFDAAKLSFGAFTIVGLILSGFLIPIIQNSETFSIRNLIVGTLGSILNTIGLSLIAKACTIGPVGPAVSLVNLNTIMFTIIEAFKLWQFPRGLEIFGLTVGFTGAMVLSMPDQMEALWRFITCKRNKSHESN